MEAAAAGTEPAGLDVMGGFVPKGCPSLLLLSCIADLRRQSFNKPAYAGFKRMIIRRTPLPTWQQKT
eukprot:scaffold99027_cov14-Tisochrysis_lutea.AAC.1